MKFCKVLMSVILALGLSSAGLQAQTKKSMPTDAAKAKAVVKSGPQVQRVEQKEMDLTWEVVAKSERDAEKSDAKRSKQDCGKNCQGVAAAKDLVIDANPDMRKDLLLSYFEELRSCKTCQIVEEPMLKSRGMSPLMACFIEYASYPSDPLQHVLPDYVILADIAGVQSYYGSQGKQSACMYAFMWEAMPRAQIPASPF